MQTEHKVNRTNNQAKLHAINPKKLLNSKWTAIHPSRKEKHFMIVELEFDEDNHVIDCQIEAVMTKRRFAIQWHELRDATLWLQGWK
jgi:tryptophan-rich hypothetical protein